MESYDGRATLEWWANPSTCLGSFDVHVEAGVTGPAWTRHATFADPSGDHQEGFDFLMALGPCFTLRFDAGSTVDVHVAVEGDLAGEGGRLVLSACEGE
ncbi:hypothetical protein ACFZAU_30280 [Streptomyces sp. NPDC008238]